LELVYLWVENYKNIHHQGFNFSPRFHCEYNEEDNRLTITENDDYIPDFFGKNINVTAIVGKNGSGKSSLLEFIYFSLHFHDETILIFKKDDKIFSISKKKINYISNDNIVILNKDSQELNNCIFPLFDYSFKKSFYIKSDRFPIFPPKYSNGKFDFLKEEHKNIKMILKNYIFMNQVKKWNLFDSYFQPKFIIIKTTKLFKEMESSPNEVKREIITSLNKEAYEQFQNKEARKGFHCLKNIINLPIFSKDQLNKEDYSKYIESTPKKDLTNELYQKNLCNYDEFKEEYKYENIKINSDEFNILEQEYEEDKTIFIWDINTLTQNEIDLILNLFSCSFKIKIFDNHGKFFNQLSYGEQQLLIILNKIFEFLLDNSIKNYLCFFDEVDIGFHPDWQKKVLSFIIEFLKLVPEKKFHLIFTTHSPFLLSDIPKENIIFLNDKPSIKQTFGANIHTLLSDSFFMEDGLMGKFAKNKIRIIKVAHKYILHKHKRKTLFTQSCKRCRRLLIKQLPKFWQIQEIIGEPFLQKIVKNQLEEIELILLGRDEAIDKEIARLQALKVSFKNA